jgi:hypothetical protein
MGETQKYENFKTAARNGGLISLIVVAVLGWGRDIFVSHEREIENRIKTCEVEINQLKVQVEVLKVEQSQHHEILNEIKADLKEIKQYILEKTDANN